MSQTPLDNFDYDDPDPYNNPKNYYKPHVPEEPKNNNSCLTTVLIWGGSFIGSAYLLETTFGDGWGNLALITGPIIALLIQNGKVEL